MVLSVFFDLDKAYDSTWRLGILYNLYSLGLMAQLPLFLQNFDKQPFGSTVAPPYLDTLSLMTGVQQGSVLSVTHFVLDFNDNVVDIPILLGTLFMLMTLLHISQEASSPTWNASFSCTLISHPVVTELFFIFRRYNKGRSFLLTRETQGTVCFFP